MQSGFCVFHTQKRPGLALNQSQLKSPQSWRAVQAETHRKDKAWRAGFWEKTKKIRLCIFTGRERQTSKLNPRILFFSLSLSIVFVCLYSWCCNHGFFSGGLPVVCIVLDEMIWWYIFLSLFSIFFLFLWQYLCMWLSHYAPKRLQSCNCLLDCGRGPGTNRTWILVTLKRLIDWLIDTNGKRFIVTGGDTSINSQLPYGYVILSWMVMDG